MAGKEWRDVIGYEGRYQVSRDGDVISLNYRCTGQPREMRPGIGANGYPQVRLYGSDGTRRTIATYVLVARAFIGPRPVNADINHKNGVKTEPHADNLEYCTRSENVKHAFSIGLADHKGERNGRCKIKDDELPMIRSLIESGMHRREIAQAYSVTPTRISQITRGDRAGA